MSSKASSHHKTQQCVKCLKHFSKEIATCIHCDHPVEAGLLLFQHGKKKEKSKAQKLLITMVLVSLFFAGILLISGLK